METQTPEFKELLLRQLPDKVNANMFRTKRKVQAEHSELTEANNWHLVKGGLNSSKSESVNPPSAALAILFNPVTLEWIKALPPNVPLQKDQDKRIKNEVMIIRASLEISGLSKLQNHVKELENLFLDGHPVFGFLTPHFGPSLDALLYQVDNGSYNVTEKQLTAEISGYIYNQAFEHACQLCLKYGFWVQDPNPGNVIISYENGMFNDALLIDFASGRQIAPTFVGQKYQEPEARKARFVRLFKEELCPLFNREATKHSIPLIDSSNQTLCNYVEKFLPIN